MISILFNARMIFQIALRRIFCFTTFTTPPIPGTEFLQTSRYPCFVFMSFCVVHFTIFAIVTNVYFWKFVWSRFEMPQIFHNGPRNTLSNCHFKNRRVGDFVGFPPSPSGFRCCEHFGKKVVNMFIHNLGVADLDPISKSNFDPFL